MKMRTISVGIIVLLLLCLITGTVYQYTSTAKTGYVVITDLYNGFEMKKEMEKKYLQHKNAGDKILDSLALEVNVLGQKIETENQKNETTIKQFESKRQEFYQRKKSYEESNNALSKQYDLEIITQLNQYVKEYGEGNGYTYVFGNDGNGSLMYAKDIQNITKEVMKHVNEKYQGRK